MFPGNVYCLLGVILPELLVTHEKEQTSGHELWLLTYRSLYRLIMNLLRKKKILGKHYKQLIVYQTIMLQDGLSWLRILVRGCLHLCIWNFFCSRLWITGSHYVSEIYGLGVMNHSVWTSSSFCSLFSHSWSYFRHCYYLALILGWPERKLEKLMLLSYVDTSEMECWHPLSCSSSCVLLNVEPGHAS